jgi:hypothetical protein
MKLQPRNIIALYFNSWWLPALVSAVVLIALIILFAAVVYITLEHLANFLRVLSYVFILSMAGILLAAVWNLVKKRWAMGFINFLFVAGAVISVYWGMSLFFNSFGSSEETTTPSIDQENYCIAVMHLNSSANIVPLGFKRQSWLDETVWFKFITDASEPAQIFDTNVIDVARFDVDEFKKKHVFWEQAEYIKWWDVKDKNLLGEEVTFPNGDGMYVGIEKQGDVCLVYILWIQI